MATSHVQPLLLLLLASLFFLPTLRGVPFEDCAVVGDEGLPTEVTSVDVFRDEGKTILKISGSTSKIITGGYMNVSVKLGLIKISDKTYDLCEYIACPVERGDLVIRSDNMLPFYPRVNLRVHIDIFNSDDEDVMCLDFKYQLSHSAVVVSA